MLTIDLNDAFDQLTDVGLRLAVAQIVSTATDIEGIESVQLRIDGEQRVWPLGNGELTERRAHPLRLPGPRRVQPASLPGHPVADPVMSSPTIGPLPVLDDHGRRW